MAYKVELDRAERGRIVVLLSQSITSLAEQISRLSGPGEVSDVLRADMAKSIALRDKLGALEWQDEPTMGELLDASLAPARAYVPTLHMQNAAAEKALADEKRECRACNGSGVVEGALGKACRYCGGTGKDPKHFGMGDTTGERTKSGARA